MASAWGRTGIFYDKFSKHLSDAIEYCVQRVDPGPDEKVLDVATGTGWAARMAALRESKVTGLDFSEELITAALQLARQYGLSVRFDVGDAENLPYHDGSFDVVLSIFGVMFVSRPEQAAEEMARVCRKGGRLGLTTWPPDGTIAQLSREVTAKYRSRLTDTPNSTSPYAWGDIDRVKELLGRWFDLQFERCCTVLHAKNSEQIWNLWESSHGLISTTLEKLSSREAKTFRDEFIAFHDRFSDQFGITMPRDYLVTIGVRK